MDKYQIKLETNPGYVVPNSYDCTICKCKNKDLKYIKITLEKSSDWLRAPKGYYPLGSERELTGIVVCSEQCFNMAILSFDTWVYYDY